MELVIVSFISWFSLCNCVTALFLLLQSMHPKLLLDADVLCVRNSSVAKMYVEQVEAVGLHAGKGLVICGTQVQGDKQPSG